ncbi:MAG: hypothetical protein IKP54_08555 [Bacteroidales bacterium]|nr:hypothetical protein [Bacteroidales bacterium]
MTYIIEHLKIIVLLLPLLLTVVHSSYAQGESGRLKNPYHSELWARELSVSNECAYALLDTINNHWKRSSLNEAPSMALIKHTALNDWVVSIVQLSMSEYLVLKSHGFSLFGALTYQNKLFVLQCIDSLDIKQTRNYFFQLQDSIKILSDYQTFFHDIRDYKFVVDTIQSAEKKILEWEILTYERFIQLICKENKNCFQCKEIPYNQTDQYLFNTPRY